ncbi:MAG: twin-arginine translocase TatA/TatE family subunit [Candidatus Omnitrophica bacterium]|nr:twin-arginine translocase TatA/TatE family subunit [Candidatus Omnitrophota bacterium]
MGGRIGFPELVVILLIVLLLFGAGKLPQIAKSMGEAIREFKKSMNSKDEDDKNEKNS